MGMWDDDNGTEEFRDIPEETGKEYVHPQPLPEAPRRPGSAPASTQTQFNGASGRFDIPIAPVSDEEFLDNLGIGDNSEIEEDFSAVLNDANLRIEQGRLYQMIMNHNLFEGMDADPTAVDNVQREIRKYARERMEIMLGMRQEQIAVQQVQVSCPFNDLEIDILKKVASRATGGATESPEANQVAAAVREVPKRHTLNPLGGSTGLKKPANVTKVPVQPPKAQQKLQSKPSTPIARSKNEVAIERILAEEGVTREELELEYVGIGKQLHELTEQELLDRHKQTAQRLAKHKTVKSSSAIPMASPEQQEMLAVQRANQMNTVDRMDGLKIPGGMAALMEKVKSMPIKNP